MHPCILVSQDFFSENFVFHPRPASTFFIGLDTIVDSAGKLSLTKSDMDVLILRII